MLDVIDAVRMKKATVTKELLSSSSPQTPLTLKNYGFYKLDIWAKHETHWKNHELDHEDTNDWRKNMIWK